MSWGLAVLAGSGLIAIGMVALLVQERSRRGLAGATVMAGIALLFAALARDRGDASALLASWLILGVWSVFMMGAWQTQDAENPCDREQEQQEP